MKRWTVIAEWNGSATSREELEVTAPDAQTASAKALVILDRDYEPGAALVSVLETRPAVRIGRLP